MNKNITAAALMVAAIALGIYQFGRQKNKVAESDDFPDDSAYWYCQTCQKQFVTSIDDYLAHYQENPGVPMPCPEDGKSEGVIRLADSMDNLRGNAAP